MAVPKIIAAIIAAFLAFATAALAETAVPKLSGRVVDLTTTLSKSDIDALTPVLKDLEDRKGSQIAVLIVPTLDGESIEQFSIRVAEAWKIGRKDVDDGAILVIAKNDRKLRIEIGRGLEGAIPDVTAKRIIDEIITPKFKKKDFAGGIGDGVRQLVKTIDGEPLPAPKRGASGSHEDNTSTIIGLLVAAVVSVFGGLMLNSAIGRILGSASVASGVTLVAWLFGAGAGLLFGIAIISFILALISDFLLEAMASGGSSDSSSSSWSSGSSRSGGSWGGGGGDFGGGGASGGWSDD